MNIDVRRPAPTFVMEFSLDESWAIIAALSEYVAQHPGAAHRDKWAQWADELDKAARADA